MLSHAAVIGGGIAGLLAAHALAPFAARVTVLERHAYPRDGGHAAPPSRRGAPQSRCLHLLMAAGAAAIDGLTPGWREELVARGAAPFDVAADAALHLRQGRMPRAPAGIIAYACSRALLETVLRDRLGAHRHVQLREACPVRGLVFAADGQRVTGLRVDDAAPVLHADLVVEASGRHSALPRWLARHPGAADPGATELLIGSGTHYVSRWFRLAPGDAPDWHWFSTAAEPGTRRAAMMMRAERECWGVVLLAGLAVPLPTDDAGFRAFAADLGGGELRAVLGRAVPLSPIHRYPPSPNRLRRFEAMAGWPDGLVALGDSVCALDPYFGLGMTAAARGALGLREHLAAGRQDARGFQAALCGLLAEPWRTATGCDLDGAPLARDAAAMDRIHAAAVARPDAARAVLSAQHLLSTTDDLLEACLP